MGVPGPGGAWRALLQPQECVSRAWPSGDRKAVWVGPLAGWRTMLSSLRMGWGPSPMSHGTGRG